MNLRLSGHDDRYAVEQLQMSLFGADAQGEAVSALHRSPVWLTAVTTITRDGKTARGVKRLRAGEETVRERRRLLQLSYYAAALQLLPGKPAWGALSGVRPTKLSTKHMLQGGTRESAVEFLQDAYFVTPARAELAADCSEATVRAHALMDEKDVSLYIGIPFCPTRCSYCSFVSRTVGKNTALLEPYLNALKQELALTGRLMRETGRTVRTVYIGGGTPTTLSESQMAALLDSVYATFDMSRCIEFTVEGGRPDTLTAEKLRAIRDHGADRMSINPQTMVDPVLRACARPHKAEDVLRAYAQAVDAGFKAINMDLIAGLPADTVEGFMASLDTVASLTPANITVHTLALKKGADLFERRQAMPTDGEVRQMVDYAEEKLRAESYVPYYLYRQKYMSGSFENVGWSRDRLDCLYNIYMMEELHTIVSIGGGGMNKVNFPDGSLKRFHNPKFPEQYIEQIDSVLQQKRELFRLLAEI